MVVGRGLGFSCSNTNIVVCGSDVSSSQEHFGGKTRAAVCQRSSWSGDCCNNCYKR